jgi:hypothetical protein
MVCTSAYESSTCWPIGTGRRSSSYLKIGVNQTRITARTGCPERCYNMVDKNAADRFPWATSHSLGDGVVQRFIGDLKAIGK